MSRKIAEEVLPRLRQRYAGRGREGRSRLIDVSGVSPDTSIGVIGGLFERRVRWGRR
jgi:hypothetical protein